VSREDKVRTFWNFVDFVNKDSSGFFKGGDNVLVVNDFLAHIYRCTKRLEGLLNGDDRAVNTGAVAARRSEKNALGLRGRKFHQSDFGAGDAGHAQTNIRCAHSFKCRRLKVRFVRSLDYRRRYE